MLLQGRVARGTSETSHELISSSVYSYTAYHGQTDACVVYDGTDVFVDLLRMQAGLALTDANRAVEECNKEVDQLGYHGISCCFLL